MLQLCRRVWLGLHDSRSHVEPDSKDEMKIRDFMAAKYEKKRWYVAPTESMLDEARKQNTIPEKKPEQARPLRTLGGHIPNLIVQSNQVSRQSGIQRFLLNSMFLFISNISSIHYDMLASLYKVFINFSFVEVIRQTVKLFLTRSRW